MKPTLETVKAHSVPGLCPECTIINPESYSFCGRCGTHLQASSKQRRNRKGSFSMPASSRGPGVLAAITLAALVLMLVGTQFKARDGAQVDPSSTSTSTDASSLTPTTGQTLDSDQALSKNQTLGKVKALWQQGAAAKKERRFADAASAWKEALDLKPGHAGLQEAIDKLPVEVSYSVESAFGISPQSCDVSFLDARQRRVHLKNVALPWRMQMVVRRGQSLSLTATSRSRLSPPKAAIEIASVAVSLADSPTLWWLGYPTGISCRAKAGYDAPSAYGPTDSDGFMPGAKDDATRFREKLKGIMGEQTDALIASSHVLDHTDIIMVTLLPSWEQVGSEDRLRVALNCYRAWKDVRSPRFGKEVYLLMIGEDAQRLGGSRYPRGARLWTVNQGKQGEVIALPAGASAEASTSDSSDGSDEDTQSQSSSSGISPSVSSSDLEQFQQRLSSAPDMDRFVSGADYLSGSTDEVKIFVTSEYNGLAYHDRLQLARLLLQMWQLVHAPQDPNKAWIILKAADGTTVGGQKVTGGVWVEE